MERKTGRGGPRPTRKVVGEAVADDLADLLDEESPAGGEAEGADVPAPPGASDASVEGPLGDAGLDLAGDVPVQVVAVLGKKTIAMREVLDLQLGQLIELNRPLSEVVDLVANGKLIARGELVEIDGKLGVRIIKMVR